MAVFHFSTDFRSDCCNEFGIVKFLSQLSSLLKMEDFYAVIARGEIAQFGEMTEIHFVTKDALLAADTRSKLKNVA